MKRKIFYLAKVFESESRMNDFLDGKIYMNTLGFFKGKEKEAYGDKHEGVTGWYQPDQNTVTINGHKLTGLASPVSVSLSHLDDINVFCITAAHIDEEAQYTEDEYIQKLRLSEDSVKFGKYLVAITDVPKFMERMKKLNPFMHGFVEYYDPNTFNGDFDEYSAIFKKQLGFIGESEYRFAFNDNPNKGEPLICDIGDIRDITMTGTPNDFIEGLRLEFPDQ